MRNKLKTSPLVWTLTILIFTSGPAVSTRAGTNGQSLFLKHCSQCHGIEGQGLRRLYPPLKKSHYFSRKVSALPCLIRNGLRGNIRLRGNVFNQTMPGNPFLNPAQLTELMQYTLRFSDRSKQVTFTENDVRQWLKQCQ